MKAAYLETTGAPDVIRYGDVPTPTPKANEILIKVGAAAVNPPLAFGWRSTTQISKKPVRFDRYAR